MLATVGIDFANNVAQAGAAAGGPPTDLPAPVPDFVTGVLDSVRSFVGGSTEKLGEAISGLTPAEN